MTTDAAPQCMRCGYDLTGLKSDTCPECGWQIDWAKAQSVEVRRIGTPAHRAKPWRMVDQTLWTLVIMLLMPWRFARQLRADESIWPSAAVAFVSFAIMFLWGARHDPNDFPAIITSVDVGCAVLLLLQIGCFGLLHFPARHERIAWYRRLKLWLIVSLYSSCFVASWPLIDEPPMILPPLQSNVFWGLNFWLEEHTAIKTSMTLIFYWWWAILATMLLVRTRPRWLAVLLIPMVFLFTWGATWVPFLLIVHFFNG